MAVVLTEVGRGVERAARRLAFVAAFQACRATDHQRVLVQCQLDAVLASFGSGGHPARVVGACRCMARWAATRNPRPARANCGRLAGAELLGCRSRCESQVIHLRGLGLPVARPFLHRPVFGLERIAFDHERHPGVGAIGTEAGVGSSDEHRHTRFQCDFARSFSLRNQ